MQNVAIYLGIYDQFSMEEFFIDAMTVGNPCHQNIIGKYFGAILIFLPNVRKAASVLANHPTKITSGKEAQKLVCGLLYTTDLISVFAFQL